MVRFANLGGPLIKREEPGKPIGHSSEGYLGRYLILLPEENLVVVRMIRWRDGYDEKGGRGF